MATRWFSVVVDSADPRALGSWWQDALGWTTIYDTGEEVVVVPPGLTGDEGVPGLVFVRVTDPKLGKNRVHLDLRSESTEAQAATVDRLLAAGATRADIGQGDAVPWVVLADPEGNEFCVLEPSERYPGEGALDAVVMDVLDPQGLADFWAAATGRTAEANNDGAIVTLLHPDGRLPHLELLRVDEPRTGKNRLHFDMAPAADDDQAAEVARLVALGAEPADVGQGPDVRWVVLTDPEGNEFCVLTPR